MNSTARFTAILALVLGHLGNAVTASDEEVNVVPVIDSRQKTTFRYFEVTATDIAQTEDGKLVAVDAISPRMIKDKKSGEWINENIKYLGRPPKTGDRKLQAAVRKSHGPLPDANWRANDFDDSEWARVSGGGMQARRLIKKENGFILDCGIGEMMSAYRSLAMMCLRSRFTVLDPARVSKLKLHIQFRGGVVLYLNGKEVGRSHMPRGELKWDSLAEAYPQDVYLNEKGELLWQYFTLHSHTYRPPHVAHWVWDRKVKDTPVKKRLRKHELVISSDALKKGVNVLAVELHRAPASGGMFTAPPFSRTLWWNRVSLERLIVSAEAEDGSIASGFTAPNTMTVTNHPVTQEFNHWKVPDLNEETRAVRIQGVRNGTSSGVLMVSSPAKLSGVKVSTTALKGKSGVIPADRIDVRYQRFCPPSFSGQGKISYWIGASTRGAHFNTLEETYDRALEGAATLKRKAPFIKVPVWFMVQIPPNTRPGVYEGSVRIAAEKQKTATVPLRVEVLGGWGVPASKDFRTFVAYDQSPETLALSYRVPLWSEPHWKLVEESLRLLGQLGNKEVLVTFTPKTFVGNEHAMLRFIKGKDGKLKADFSIVDRYIGLAAKHMGRIPSVCTIFSYGSGGNKYASSKAIRQRISVMDPATKTIADDDTIPDWGTPEALTFWKPVMDAYLAILKKHKVGPNPVFYWSQFSGVNGKAWTDLKKLAPGLLHMNRSHITSERGRGEIGKSRLYNAVVACSGAGALWDPDLDPHFYGWRHKMDVITCPREGTAMHVAGMRDISLLSKFRLFPEATLLHGVGGQYGKRPERYYRAGFGQFGADFWPVALGEDSGKSKKFNLTYRYSSENSAGYIMKEILGRGVVKPCPTGRFQMLREGLQEAEARMFVTDALLDQPDKLGAELTKRCEEVCNRQTRLHRHFAVFANYGKLAPQVIREKTRELYLLAGEVKKALNIR